MSENQENPGVMDRLSASLNSALTPLGRGAPGAMQETLAFSDAAEDDTALLSGGDDAMRNADLTRQLTYSVQQIGKRDDAIQQGAADLTAAMEKRSAGERRITVWGFRFLIGVAWLGLAWWLHDTALQARADQLAVTAMGVPVADAGALSNTFSLIGALAAATALIMILRVYISGDATNAKLSRVGAAFGVRLAEETRDLNRRLKENRDAVVGAKGRGDGLSAASQAHLVAHEAAIFFRGVSFLTTADEKAADKEFRAFLNRYYLVETGYSALEMLSMLLVGAFFGWAGTIASYAPELFSLKFAPLAIVQYPFAAQAFFIGLSAYALVGVTMMLLSDFVGGDEMKKARKAALDSLRSAYTAQEAPLATEVIRQVEDVVEILRARLGGVASGGKSASTTAPAANQSPAYRALSLEESAAADKDAADPGFAPWRRRDSSVKFVDPVFSASPFSWRTDAFAKKMSSKNNREPGSKRDHKAPKNSLDD